MVSEKIKNLLENSSVIRAMFEDGKKMAEKFGQENVYDFSLGNPSVYPPERLKTIIKSIVDNIQPDYLHGYMNNSGYEEVREKIALSLNKRFGTDFSFNNIIMTVGAAGGLNVAFKTILNPDDEVLTFSPYFGEYKHYADNFGAVLVPIKPNIAGSFKPDIEDLRQAITPKTKALIVNTPNNPTGVVYSENDIKAIADILSEKSKETGHTIFLISDEPYRELVYDGVKVPYLTKYYNNTIVCYSYSKSLSLPGERIGYLVIPNEIEDFSNMVAAANTATRILGFVNAPSLMQLAIAECLTESIDISIYEDNRNKLMDIFDRLGFSYIYPEGAFYLFMETPYDDRIFAENAKKERLLLVPGSAFGCSGYVRIAYCVAPKVIDNAYASFERLAKNYKYL
ncbi:MAG: pyridoxal phosphate-dependent aminotransferase [Catonella sp.]|uniref:pyridoxal phosphate-dependent aminotransferase n=1 Tax=Catonella sp. TaxID=2382125 RepID=UPI003FA00360